MKQKANEINKYSWYFQFLGGASEKEENMRLRLRLRLRLFGLVAGSWVPTAMKMKELKKKKNKKKTKRKTGKTQTWNLIQFVWIISCESRELGFLWVWQLYRLVFFLYRSLFISFCKLVANKYLEKFILMKWLGLQTKQKRWLCFRWHQEHNTRIHTHRNTHKDWTSQYQRMKEKIRRQVKSFSSFTK